jgi:predicted small secreted protein
MAAHNRSHRTRTILGTIAVAATLLVAGLMAACNTVEGAGKDIEGAGRGIKNTAEDAKN